MNNYSQRRTRSASRPRPVPLLNLQFNIAKYINSLDSGCLDLRSLRNFLHQDVDPKGRQKFQAVWKLVQEKNNFILSEPSKDAETLNGNETIWVRTVLTLCKTHCRQGKDGRNRACDGDCGALHICRTFLLRGNACPFNSKKKMCMFGHSFNTDHNVELLKTHNLHGLNEIELQKLFRRRPSRTASTLPQVCIYYNKAEGKKCSRENCRSLHLCSEYIQQACDEHCDRNHKLTTPQVQRVLEFFAIDRTWTPVMLLDDLRHFMTARHRNDTGGSYSDSDDSDATEHSDYGKLMTGEGLDARYASQHSLVDHDTHTASSHKAQSCKDCELLKIEVQRMQISISCLTTQVKEINTALDDLKAQNTNKGRPRNQPLDSSGAENAPSTGKIDNSVQPSSVSFMSAKRDPQFIGPDFSRNFSGVQPNSALFGARFGSRNFNSPD